jgi:SAM-dependent methyltransferase
MKRQFLFSFFETPVGKLLQGVEKKYIKRSIHVSCKQTILQIGALGWEHDFIDCSLYRDFYLVDSRGSGTHEAHKIQSFCYQLPIQTESVDLVILPHLLEFDAHRFRTLREIDRVLKPGGEILILHLNPFNIWVRLQSLWDRKMSHNWMGHFLSRTRVCDWLKVLNCEIKTTTELTEDALITTPAKFRFGKLTFIALAYGVVAVKRKYTLIPLASTKSKKAKLISATTLAERRRFDNNYNATDINIKDER